MIAISDLGGLWQRSLIVRPDGTRDTSTWVAWLQGPVFFADLRIPADRPSFSAVQCRDDLTPKHVRWLAGQEGFAGRLLTDGPCVLWQRDLDLQPTTQLGDAGRLRMEGNIMIEEGRDVPYVEHWWHDARSIQPHGAARLADTQGQCGGYIIRAGERFMFARSRTGKPMLADRTLMECVETSQSVAAARDLIDTEISFGQVTPDSWTITRSSLPYREGANLAPAYDTDADNWREATLRTRDVTSDGRLAVRRWTILESEGQLFAPSPAGTSAAV